MEDNKIIVAITQGDINGVGYEVILKAFDNPMMLDLCTPVVYGSPKVAAYHRKAMDLNTNFTIVNSAADADSEKLNVVTCTADEVKVDFGKADSEAAKAASDALQKVVEEYHDRLVDVLVTAPVNHQTLCSDAFPFHTQHGYLEQAIGEGCKSLAIYVKDNFRMASATGNMPLREVPAALTPELLKERLEAFAASLRTDFGIDAPRIAVLSLNPRKADAFGSEEEYCIRPVIAEEARQGILCFGPFPVDEFMGREDYLHYDGVLAMYHDQGLAVFNTLSQEEGVVYTAGLPLVRTAPIYDAKYEVVGKGMMDEASFRQAIYLALDIYRQRERERVAHANPLRKQYYDRRDDSDKLKQMNTNTEDEL